MGAVLCTILGLFLLATHLQAQSLGEVLRQNNVPVTLLPEEESGRSITGFAILDRGTLFLIAYYEKQQENLLEPPLHVLSYSRPDRAVRRATLLGEKATTFPFVAKERAILSAICMGSVLGIAEAAGFVTIDTHINPSAGCLLVLTDQLQFQAQLYGWALAPLSDGALLLQGSEVHFAATHPASLFVYSPQTDALEKVYPRDADPDRKDYVEAIHRALNEAGIPLHCRARDTSCIAELLSSSISEVLVAADGRSFRFTAQLSSEGWTPDDQEPRELIPSKAVHYRCDLISGHWVSVALDGEQKE